MTIQEMAEATLTAHQLARQLLAGPDLPVFGSVYDYGDRAHTSVAPIIKETLEGYVKWSNYCSSPAVVDEDRDDRDESKEVAAILLY